MTENILTLGPGENGTVGNMTVTNTSDETVRLAVEGEGPAPGEKPMFNIGDTAPPVLLLTLDPEEKGIVGSMTVTNTSDKVIRLDVEGEGPVLREKQILKIEDATTPTLKIYYMVTHMYLDPDFFEQNHKIFTDMSRELISEVPSTITIMSGIGESIIKGNFRAALDECFDLMQYELYLGQIAAGEIEPPDKLASTGKKEDK